MLSNNANAILHTYERDAVVFMAATHLDGQHIYADISPELGLLVKVLIKLAAARRDRNSVELSSAVVKTIGTSLALLTAILPLESYLDKPDLPLNDSQQAAKRKREDLRVAIAMTAELIEQVAKVEGEQAAGS